MKLEAKEANERTQATNRTEHTNKKKRVTSKSEIASLQIEREERDNHNWRLCERKTESNRSKAQSIIHIVLENRQTPLRSALGPIQWCSRFFTLYLCLYTRFVYWCLAVECVDDRGIEKNNMNF